MNYEILIQIINHTERCERYFFVKYMGGREAAIAAAENICSMFERRLGVEKPYDNTETTWSLYKVPSHLAPDRLVHGG